MNSDTMITSKAELIDCLFDALQARMVAAVGNPVLPIIQGTYKIDRLELDRRRRAGFPCNSRRAEEGTQGFAERTIAGHHLQDSSLSACDRRPYCRC